MPRLSVASAQEAARLSRCLPAGMLIVTPGIQLRGAAANDQVRVSTPAIARASGATHVVIGRSITRASSPREAFAEAWASMQNPTAA